MPRTIWKGALNFGLVNVPVGLYSATQDKTVHFNQFEEGTSDRIRYKKVNERTGAEVPAAKIVKGFDLGGGDYVLLTDDELDSAEPEKSKLIEITDFVDLEQIDPVFYRSTYYLAPEGEAANKAYALLRQVMRKANKVAIGTVVMRNKEYPVAIRPDDEVLKLETMYFADEIRSPTKDLPDLPGEDEVTDRELQMAVAPPRIDGERLGSGEVPRHPPPAARSHHRGQAPGQRDRHRGRAGAGDRPRSST
jgi:DNA end-binding protein Ku